jgi:hypothetical protein
MNNEGCENYMEGFLTKQAETLSFWIQNQDLPCKSGYFSYFNYFKEK